VHHSSQQLDFLAAYRVHPIDQFMVRSVTLIPVFVLGFDATALLLFAVIYHWHGMLLHSNTKFRFGWLERIVATPAYHHWHHAKGAVQTCNFAGQLALIDVIFGTYRESRTNRPDEYGIDAEMPGNYLGQLISPFRQRHSRPQITQQASTS
jgi:sterol desaturase/sphingolipid hydroxylase (fatty acid hydroxylase superfamily)